MSLTDAQLDRYARHIILKEIGGAGQARLLQSIVAVVGAGGIGSPAIQYLAAAGVGRLRVIDDDAVDLSNLQRQTLFGTDQLGMAKVAGVADAVRALNPEVRVEMVQQRLTEANARALLEGADVVVDGTDNFATRLAVADAAQELRVPLVSAAIGQFEGQIAVFRGWEAGLPCYRCFVGSDPARDEANCAEQGVIGAMAGMIGSLAALEAMRCIVPFGRDSAGSLVIADALDLRFRTIALPKDPGCPGCSG